MRLCIFAYVQITHYGPDISNFPPVRLSFPSQVHSGHLLNRLEPNLEKWFPVTLYLTILGENEPIWKVWVSAFLILTQNTPSLPRCKNLCFYGAIPQGFDFCFAFFFLPTKPFFAGWFPNYMIQAIPLVRAVIYFLRILVVFQHQLKNAICSTFKKVFISFPRQIFTFPQ